MSGTIPKTLKPLAKAAKKQGWKIEVTGSTHLLWTNPEGETVSTAMTINDRGRQMANYRAALRRAGLKI